ncbi:MAG: uracil-DNA glycosylase [Anaerolineae bacterium]|nr:uracil-DNA glycosylase [Anaerolineae bacterium]
MSALSELNEQIITCTRCSLHAGRTRAVPGEGPENPQILFIGEAPGFHEDRSGRPFVGASGQFLEQMLEGIGLKRTDVFIANVIKCRPPGNREPQPAEIETCKPYLDRQIELLKPKVVITLGRFSMARYFPGAKVSDIHGQPRKIGNVLYIPMFHPAAALHQPGLRRTVEEDMAKIPALLAQFDQVKETPPSQDVEQLSLF